MVGVAAWLGDVPHIGGMIMGTSCHAHHYSPDLVAKGMLQLLLDDKSKDGAAMMV